MLLKVSIDSGVGVYAFKERFADGATIHDLFSKVFEKSGPREYQLFVGFPPKAIHFSSVQCTLLEVGIISGSIITVRKMPKIVKRVVDADNSCIFNSVHYCINHNRDFKPKDMRHNIANFIMNRPEKYNESLLGRPPSEYVEWIQEPSSWGGEIELEIMCNLFSCEIGVVYIQSKIILIYKQEDANEQISDRKKTECRRIFLEFDGIHYDPLVATIKEEEEGGGGKETGKEESKTGEVRDVTQFRGEDEWVYQKCLQYAEEKHTQQQFVDLKGFSLKCLVCNVGLRGQIEAQAHAETTSHQNFAQI